jgi:anti-sigma regulatory factor (Ser/Thr protein kinase)
LSDWQGLVAVAGGKVNGVEPLQRRVRAEAAAIADVRRSLRAWLEEAEADRVVIDELLVVVSELCAHAVAHASPGDVSVDATLDHDIVWLQVTAVRDTEGVIAIGRAADPLADGHPGRLVVDQLCDGLRSTTTPGGSVLRCHRHRLDSARPARDQVRRPGR